MIIYDKDHKLIGMGKKALEILEYDSLDDFLSKHKDLDEITQNYQKKDSVSFIQDVLNSSVNGKKFYLQTKSGRTAIIIVKAQPIFFAGHDKMYELELFLQDMALGGNSVENVNLMPELRLPLLQATKKADKTQNYNKIMLINYEWLEKTRNFLNLEKDEFIAYMEIFIQGVKKSDIALQNAIITHNVQSIKKIVAKLKEPATNLHITPLVKIYTDIQNSTHSDVIRLVLNAKEFMDEFKTVLYKYQERA